MLADSNQFNLMTLRRHYHAPHQLYHALRAHDSLYFDEDSRCWLVTGHSAMTTLLTHAGLSSTPGSAASSRPSIRQQMLFLDGPRHQEIRTLISRFLARTLPDLREDILAFAQAVLSLHQERGEMDIVKDYASLISLLTIAHVLGIPAQSREELLQLERWSDAFGDLTTGYLQVDLHDILQLEKYFHELIAMRRYSLSDDLISVFIQHEELFPTEDDLLATCLMIFAAGRFTVKKLLGNGISLLLPHWDSLQQRFRKHSRELPKSVGEELLRTITPTRYLIRQADTQIDLTSLFSGKHIIGAGEYLFLFLEAGNYDPAVFSLPDELDLSRHPNKHLAFGYGNHACPGASLARLEIQLALETLLSLPQLRSKPGPSPSWNPNPNLGGYLSYPVIFRL